MPLLWKKATDKDSGFIFSLILNGARKGHFEPGILVDKEGYRAYLHCAISREIDPRGYPTLAWVGWNDNTRVAAAIMTAAVGTPDIGMELAMIAMKSEFQGLGLGSEGLDTLLNLYLPQGSVYVRCFPASQRFRQMLTDRDFVEVGELGGAVILRHPQFDAQQSATGTTMPEAA